MMEEGAGNEQLVTSEQCLKASPYSRECKCELNCDAKKAQIRTNYC